MSNVSIDDEITEAEAALTRLCEAIQRKTQSKEIRQEYHTLMNQATGALNKLRSIAETDDFFRSNYLRSFFNRGDTAEGR